MSVGFDIAGSANSFTGNAANGNGFGGIDVVVGSGNLLEGNTANGNGGRGFALFGAFANILTGNTASGNGGPGHLFVAGFLVFRSHENTLPGNTATGNVDGFVLEGARLNIMSGNAVTDHSKDGFRVDVRRSDILVPSERSVENTITDNVIASNMHGIRICQSLLPPDNTIAPNNFGGHQQAISVDRDC